MIRGVPCPLLEGLDAFSNLKWIHFQAFFPPSPSRPFQKFRGIVPRDLQRVELLNNRSFGAHLPSRLASELRNGASSMAEEEDWEVEILDEIDPLKFLSPNQRNSRRNRKGKATAVNVVEDESDSFGWAEQARNRAYLTILARDPKAVDYLRRKPKRRSRKKSVPENKNIRARKARAQFPGVSVDASLRQEEAKHNMDVANPGMETERNSGMAKWQMQGESKMIFAPEFQTNEEVRMRERGFNKRLIEARDAHEVLEIVGIAMERVRLRGAPSLLSPMNAATALHRIAKHMEIASTPRGDRLAFARHRDMAELVGTAMEVLPGCSAQGLSNIAWALSKVGGSSLYWSEMDRIAEAAMTRTKDFNAQNIANIAGAYASMRHLAPPLFAESVCHAARIAESFKPQELAQLIWAFAALFHRADSLFDALDRICLCLGEGKQRNDTGSSVRLSSDGTTGHGIATEPKLQEAGSMEAVNRIVSRGGGDRNWTGELKKVQSKLTNDAELGQATCIGKSNAEVRDEPAVCGSDGEALQTSDPGTSGQVNPLTNATKEQLANIAWSYAVLDELDRPSFAYIWQNLVSVGSRDDDSRHHEDSDRIIRCMSQMYQVHLCLQYEYPHLGLTLSSSLKDLAAEAWKKQKSSVLYTSVHQKDVEWLLVATGHNWLAEYTAADYSLDLALVERKIGLEIDGPAHFTRNTGAPLGNTVLKRRFLASAGWTVLSISYQEWEDLDGEAEQMLFLKRLLKDHV